jgi:hypothetical protein
MHALIAEIQNYLHASLHLVAEFGLPWEAESQRHLMPRWDGSQADILSVQLME